MNEKHRQTIAQASAAHGERNDCTVKALALLTGWDYETAHAWCAQHGRRRRCGFTTDRGFGLFLSRELSGFAVDELPDWGRCTVRRLGERLPSRGRFLLEMHGHVAAYVDGQVMDWTEGRRHRVTRVWRIRPLELAQAEHDHDTERAERARTAPDVWDAPGPTLWDPQPSQLSLI